MTPTGLEGKRVLIIEDNAENTRLFRAILKLEGVAEVLEADRAQLGIELAVKNHPDLILMDIQMPDMDGIAATRILRSQPGTAGIPIVAVTASVTDKDRQEILEAGCDEHIAKPIDPASFVQQIASHLQPAPRPAPDFSADGAPALP